MKAYIYQLENLITGESYIGQSVDFKRRKAVHLRELRGNYHFNPKLQNSWNKYGEQEFHWRHWEFEVSDQEELNQLEKDYIVKYNSYTNGFNMTEGGDNPPSRQKVKNEDIVGFLCLEQKYGGGYGKAFESVLGWSRGTASAAKRRIRFLPANDMFDALTQKEKDQIGQEYFEKYKIAEAAMKRQLNQGGAAKAYALTNDDFYFAFAAQELHFGYSCTAQIIGVKPATIKDWFNGRSRAKEKASYLKLPEDEKEIYRQKVRESEIESLQNQKEIQLRNKKLKSIN